MISQNQDARLFITRPEYDRLVAKQPMWMGSYWHKLDRRWSLAGVSVTGRDSLIKFIEKTLGLYSVEDTGDADCHSSSGYH